MKKVFLLSGLIFLFGACDSGVQREEDVEESLIPYRGGVVNPPSEVQEE